MNKPEKTMPAAWPGQLRTACSIVALLLVLAACGQRGPLFLPEDEPRPEASQAETETQDEETDEGASGT